MAPCVLQAHMFAPGSVVQLRLYLTDLHRRCWLLNDIVDMATAANVMKVLCVFCANVVMHTAVGHVLGDATDSGEVESIRKSPIHSLADWGMHDVYETPKESLALGLEGPETPANGS